MDQDPIWFSRRTEIFKSAMLPSKFVFRQHDQRGYKKVIFKVGNDLRQDQLALSMINLFNRILLDSGLDFGITPYKALATSADSGILIRRIRLRSCLDYQHSFDSCLQMSRYTCESMRKSAFYPHSQFQVSWNSWSLSLWPASILNSAAS